jgi:HEAT repeat protein
MGCEKSTMTEIEAQKVLHDFYTFGEPEPYAATPLVKAGRAIVPYLVVEIQNKKMPKRRYAISALEKLGDRRALPVLTEILEDENEEFYVRGDALRAIWHIDKKIAEELSIKYAGKVKDLDRTIQLLRAGKI